MTGEGRSPTMEHAEEELTRTVVIGPAGSGKSEELGEMLRAFAAEHGSNGVAVLDFSPGLGWDTARLNRRLDLPPDAWTAIVDTGSPRVPEIADDAQHRIAAENARLAEAVLGTVPDRPELLVVNDATLPFLGPDADIAQGFEHLEAADHALLSVHEDVTPLAADLATEHARLRERLLEWAEAIRRCE